MLNIVIFGPPGAGKGTQSKFLIEKHQLHHSSTGDMFRYHMKENTPLGQRVKEIINSGKLVSDNITIAMLKEEVVNHPEAKGFLFDGFPRTVNQAKALDTLMISLRSKINFVLELEVTEEEVRSRIAQRKEQEGRSDDATDTLEKRINEYYQKTIHVLPFYKEQGRLISINGIGSVASISDEIDQQMRTYL